MYKITLLFFFFVTSFLQAQVDKSDALHLTLQAKDSLLFDAAFNTCDSERLEKMISEDCVFYHDQSGVLPTKAAFIESIINGLCKMNYKPRRVVLKESLETFPLHNNGELYGAIQMGKHQFFAKYDEKQEEQLTSTARFTHVWTLEDETWRLTKVLSFDHQSPGK